MPLLRHHIAGRSVKTRDAAEAAFWADMETANGVRRSAPKAFIEITQVRRSGKHPLSGWDIYYKVPSRVLRKALEATRT